MVPQQEETKSPSPDVDVDAPAEIGRMAVNGLALVYGCVTICLDELKQIAQFGTMLKERPNTPYISIRYKGHQVNRQAVVDIANWLKENANAPLHLLMGMELEEVEAEFEFEPLVISGAQLGEQGVSELAMSGSEPVVEFVE